MRTVLGVTGYSPSFGAPEGEIQAVRNVGFALEEEEILAIIGESGCGKTVLCKSLLRLLSKNAAVKNGQVALCGEDITAYSRRRMRSLREKQISIAFQDPMTTLNPTIPVGEQITEAILKHQEIGKQAAKAQTLELLRRMEIDHPEERFETQPHLLSGEVRQRCVLAITLASCPKVLMTNEPTTTLDMTMQAKMPDLVLSTHKESGIAVLFISHGLSVIARIADRVATMCAGKIVEISTAEEVFYGPHRPYTWGPLGTQPALAVQTKQLHSIPGMPPSLLNPPAGDLFAPHSEHTLTIDYKEMSPLFQITPTHFTATWLLHLNTPYVEPPVFLKGRPQR